jgi:hypothetical protein
LNCSLENYFASGGEGEDGLITVTQLNYRMVWQAVNSFLHGLTQGDLKAVRMTEGSNQSDSRFFPFLLQLCDFPFAALRLCGKPLAKF